MPSSLPERLRALLALPDAERKLGAFRLKHQLGQGGFAPVWLADEVAGATTLRQAAIKLFETDARLGEAARQDIIAEAERLCRVEHPNIVRFYALPVDEARGVMGLAMEYVGGPSVAARLLEMERLPVGMAVDVGIAVASALAAVHAAGLVHRDVAPANVIENEALRGSPAAYKLIDFGIAMARPWPSPTDAAGTTPALAGQRGSAGSLRSLVPGAAVGKRGYVDPVCWRGQSPETKESDLYALGALLFVCLSGSIPAAARGSLDERVLSGGASPPRVSEVRSDVPAGLSELVAELLAPEPERRPLSAEVVAVTLEQLRGDLSGRARSLPPDDEGPFRGLSRFERRHRDVFFGRRVEVALAVEVLRTRGLLALVGPSGTGKSSLARAGVLPALEEGALGGPWPWDMAVLSPGADPWQSLTTALFHMGVSASLGPAEAAARIEHWLAENRRGLVLLVDQLEELVTLGGEAASGGLSGSRASTMELLARLGERVRPGLRVIVTARRDLLDPILAHRALGQVLMRGTVLVSPLRGPEWGLVLDAALGSYGVSLENAALREELNQEIERSVGAMPLVEFALSELWRERDREKKQITWESWKKLGGIAGALEQHAESTICPGGRAVVDEALTRRLLLSLTTPSGARASRRFKELTDSGRDAAAALALRLLEDARLIVREGDGVTLSHEILLTHWRRLAAWVAEEKEDRLLIEDLERVAELWVDKRDDELLFRRRRVLLVTEALRRRRVSLEGPAKRFYRASRLAAVRSRVVLVSTLAALSVAAVVVALVYQDLRARAAAAELQGQLQAKARANAELERDKATAERDKAEAERQKQAADFAYKLLAAQSAGVRSEAGGAPRGPKPIESGVLEGIERYVLEQLREKEVIPEPLENVIPEAIVASAASAPTEHATEAVVATIAARPPAPPTRTLALGAAYSSLRSAKDRWAPCSREDGPRGGGKVALVLSPSGNVSSVTMDARFVGTGVGRCVDAAFRRVEVPPFEGKPITVLWSFNVR